MGVSLHIFLFSLPVDVGTDDIGRDTFDIHILLCCMRARPVVHMMWICRVQAVQRLRSNVR